MASRKKKPDPEIVPDDLEIDAKQVKQPTRKVVETKTVTYDAPPDEAEAPEEEPEFEFETTRRRSKPTLKEEKQKLRDRWAKRGIAPTGNLRISLWKFTNEDDPMSGAQADKAFCSKFTTTEDAIDSGIHLEAASKFGPGRYWIMIYLNNQIVDQWEFKIAAGQQMGHIQNGQQVVSMPDPQNPGQVIVQMPAGQPMPPQKTFKQELKEMAETFKLMQELNGNSQQQQNPAPPQLSVEEQVAVYAMKQPDLVKKAFKSFLGPGGDSEEKSVMTTIIEHAEPIGKAIEGILDKIADRLLGAKQNGAAQMAQTAFQNGNVQIPFHQAEQNTQAANPFTQENNQMLEGNQSGEMAGLASTQPAQVRPEDELLAGILDHCKRKMPPKLAADRAMKYAEYIEGIAPQQSVFTIIEAFTDNPVAESLALLAMANEEAAEIVKLPHAEMWASQLQAELKKAYEPGGEQ